MLVGSNSTLCGHTVQETHLVGDSAFSAEVFVAVAILAFCYCMAALLIYLGYMDSYRNPQGSSWSQTVRLNLYWTLILWIRMLCYKVAG